MSHNYPNKQVTTPHELRQRLFTCIDKLSDRSTFLQASNELDHLAKSLPSDSLPTFLSCILTVDSSAKSPVRVHCVNLLSVLASVHGTGVLSPHVPKIVTSLLRRLREHDSAVRSACVNAVACLSPMSFSNIVDALMQCVSTEQEVGAQIGGCLCLKAAIEAVDGDDDVEVGEVRKRVLGKVMKLVKSEGYKAKGGLMGVVGSVVGVSGGVVVGGRGVVGSVVGVAVEILSCEDWVARKAAAECLLVVAEVVEEELVGEVKGFVVKALESRRFDKVKVTRETMNRAWEAWKEVRGGPEEDAPLSRSNSSISKGYSSSGSSPPLPRRSSFAGTEIPKSKKTMSKTRSSLSDIPVATTSTSSVSTSTRDVLGRETPQRKKTLSKSRSSLSDDSTITDSSSVSKSSHDFGFETPQSKKPMSKNRSILPDDMSIKKSPSRLDAEKSSPYHSVESKKFSDWKVEIAVPPATSTKLGREDDMQPQTGIVEVTTSGSEMRSNLMNSEERGQKSAFRYGSRVVPFVGEDDSHGLDVGGGAKEERSEKTADVQELSLIRNQLLQIERQQSNLLDLVQRFMGNSQNGIDSLETRVSGLERALDEISYDLAVQTGRIPNNGSAASTCCPSTEFLSPKFWRRTEGRSSNSKISYSGGMPNKDTNAEALHMDGYRLHEQNESKFKESRGSVEFNPTKSVKGISQNIQRGRTCSPRSLDAASTTTCMTPVRGT